MVSKRNLIPSNRLMFITLYSKSHLRADSIHLANDYHKGLELFGSHSGC